MLSGLSGFAGLFALVICSIFSFQPLTVALPRLCNQIERSVCWSRPMPEFNTLGMQLMEDGCKSGPNGDAQKLASRCQDNWAANCLLLPLAGTALSRSTKCAGNRMRRKADSGRQTDK